MFLLKGSQLFGIACHHTLLIQVQQLLKNNLDIFWSNPEV